MLSRFATQVLSGVACLVLSFLLLILLALSTSMLAKGLAFAGFIVLLILGAWLSIMPWADQGHDGRVP